MSNNRKSDNPDSTIIAGAIVTIIGLVGVIALSLMTLITQLKYLHALPDHASRGGYWTVTESDVASSYLYLLVTAIVLVIGVVMTLHGLLSKFGHHDCNNQLES